MVNSKKFNFLGGKREVHDVPDVWQTDKQWQQVHQRRSELKEKGHPYYERRNFKDLSRDELLFIYRGVKKENPTLYKEEIKPLAKGYAKDIGWGGREIYYRILDQILSQKDKDRWVYQLDLIKNKHVFNETEMCFGYEIQSIKSSKKNNINLEGLSALYSGRPRDAAALITYMLTSKPEKLQKLIEDTNQNSNEFRHLTRGVVDYTKNKEGYSFVSFTATIQRTIVPKNKGDGVYKLPGEEMCEFVYDVTALVKHSLGAYKIIRSKAHAHDGRQACKYKLSKTHTCVPKHRRGSFLQKPDMKSIFKYQALSTREKENIAKYNKLLLKERKQKKAKTRKELSELFNKATDMIKRGKPLDTDEFEDQAFFPDVMQEKEALQVLDQIVGVESDELLNLADTPLVMIDEIHEDEAQEFLDSVPDNVQETAEDIIKAAADGDEEKVKKFQKILKRTLGDNLKKFVETSAAIFKVFYGFKPTLLEYNALAKFITKYTNHPAVVNLKAKIGDKDSWKYWGLLYLAANTGNQEHTKNVHDKVYKMDEEAQITTKIDELKKLIATFADQDKDELDRIMADFDRIKGKGIMADIRAKNATQDDYFEEMDKYIKEQYVNSPNQQEQRDMIKQLETLQNKLEKNKKKYDDYEKDQKNIYKLEKSNRGVLKTNNISIIRNKLEEAGGYAMTPRIAGMLTTVLKEKRVKGTAYNIELKRAKDLILKFKKDPYNRELAIDVRQKLIDLLISIAQITPEEKEQRAKVLAEPPRQRKKRAKRIVVEDIDKLTDAGKIIYAIIQLKTEGIPKTIKNVMELTKLDKEIILFHVNRKNLPFLDNNDKKRVVKNILKYNKDTKELSIIQRNSPTQWRDMSPLTLQKIEHAFNDKVFEKMRKRRGQNIENIEDIDVDVDEVEQIAKSVEEITKSPRKSLTKSPRKSPSISISPLSKEDDLFGDDLFGGNRKNKSIYSYQRK